MALAARSLPVPGVAGQQDRRGGALCDAFEQRLDGLHRRRGADDRIERILAPLAAPQRPHFTTKLTGLERFLDQQHDFVEIERLVDVVVGPEPHRLDGVFDGREGGHHDDLRFRPDLLDAFEHRQAVAVGKLEVEEHEIDLGRRHPIERLGRETCLEDVIALGGQALAQRPADQRFVVNDQQSSRMARASV